MFWVKHICSDVLFIWFVEIITVLITLDPVKLVVEGSKYRPYLLTIKQRSLSWNEILPISNFGCNHLLLKATYKCLKTWLNTTCFNYNSIIEVVYPLVYKVVNYLLKRMHLLLFVF